MQDVLRDLADPANGFAHLSYIFLIAAMLMTSLRWLRVFALASGIAAMAHFTFRTQDNASLVWETAFVLANGVQLVLLQYRSRRRGLTPEEDELLHSILKIEDRADQRRVLALLEWREFAPGGVLMEEGEWHPPLIYLASGAASIELEGKIISSCGAGDFVGEISYIGERRASATVRVSNAMRAAQFDHEGLAALAVNEPAIAKAIDGALNRSLAAKLVRMNLAAKQGTDQLDPVQIGG